MSDESSPFWSGSVASTPAPPRFIRARCRAVGAEPIESPLTGLGHGGCRKRATFSFFPRKNSRDRGHKFRCYVILALCAPAPPYRCRSRRCSTAPSSCPAMARRTGSRSRWCWCSGAGNVGRCQRMMPAFVPSPAAAQAVGGRQGRQFEPRSPRSIPSLSASMQGPCSGLKPTARQRQKRDGRGPMRGGIRHWQRLAQIPAFTIRLSAAASRSLVAPTAERQPTDCKRLSLVQRVRWLDGCARGSHGIAAAENRPEFRAY